ncbi:Aquaporin [Rasamsonia emersonii CBS 393.64]|uniref:Aquaporin n=1 Tax=Rasamsonia emersonii (strain ATCC 16479 / CBS 393.64 / IMI 116815) TaxID=1408163 RepID=A0A0F4YFX3_RASE3|nr:Aquaporin [Rasamsonia emersonii CBS 393.64]KKA16528.1 Aquaporin [Rasamsonia emersonii CBS 393.64]
MLGEFVGTFLFLFWSFAGTQIANTPKPPEGADPNPAALLYASLSFGFSLTVNVWAFYRVTGGLFNPSVTLALYLVGGLPLLRSVLVFIAQILGGLAAAGVVSCLFPGSLNVETTLGGGTSISRGLFIEMFLTTQLVFVVIMLAAVKHKATFLAPVGIGLSFFVTELAGIYYTGGSLNFARSLGPAVVNHHFPGYFWIYFVGPLLGSLLASAFFYLLNQLRYQTCNPGQDYNELEAQMEKERSASQSTPGENLQQGPRHTRNMSELTAVNSSNGHANDVAHAKQHSESPLASPTQTTPPAGEPN